ncbi:MAG: S-layer homology domain-containing protein [Oscillospiraceae bacterium]|nr:S-layer homology domain-containing protein [Oscillospiraceae bacterium]
MKKILALLLAVVMVCGMIATASAAEFTDAAEIDKKNTEAVAVFSELGIIGGMGDGTFQPNGTLTRAQAAKIIAYMLLGKDGAEALPADTAAFADVPTSHWSCKYVNYCAEKGIVSGVGSGKFNPSGTLTGFAFGKMLLVSALGFNAEEEKLVGSDWDLNVNRLLKSERLNMGVTVSSDGISRQNACHLALNALFHGEEDDPYETLAYKTYKVTRMGAKGEKKDLRRPNTVYTSENENAYWDGTDLTVQASPFFVSPSGTVTGGKIYTAVGERELSEDQVEVWRNGIASKTVTINAAKGVTAAFESNRNMTGISMEGYYDAVNDFYTFLVSSRKATTIVAVTPAIKSGDGRVIEPGSVTLANGGEVATDDFTEADVGRRVITRGVSSGTSWANEFESVVEVIRGTIVTGVLSAASKTSVTVAGKTYNMPDKNTKTTGEDYLNGGGQIGDTVNIITDEYNCAYDIWQ